MGGGGGGGIELGAVNTVSMLATGQILADGGRGQSIASSSIANGGGGGAGGGILMHGLNVSQTGLLSAKGGNGGAQQSSGGLNQAEAVVAAGLCLCMAMVDRLRTQALRTSPEAQLEQGPTSHSPAPRAM